jgi:hypothetical protein
MNFGPEFARPSGILKQNLPGQAEFWSLGGLLLKFFGGLGNLR